MRIGIDFDNTIVSYDALFYKVARERDLVPSQTPVNKVAVRDYLRSVGCENHWTEMQGYIYGARMNEAAPYDGVVDFIRSATQAGHHLFIVSHKTRYPFAGPKYDLHAAARQWIDTNLNWHGEPLIATEDIFFELTKDEKLARVAACGCSAFIDDLPEILLAADFPEATKCLLFDPEAHHLGAASGRALSVRSWQDLMQHFNV